MKNVLIFACISAIAAAVAIYFAGESQKHLNGESYDTDYDEDMYLADI